MDGLTLRDEIKRVNDYMKEFLPVNGGKGKAGEIFQAVMMDQGKQLRPKLLLLAGRLGPDYARKRDRLCKLAALIELTHMASLIHDDIIDNSPLRRGKPTIQARFGKDMAVYAGDLILGRLLRILIQEEFHEPGLLIGKTIEDMCRGEIGQFDCRFRMEVSVEEYLSNIYGKTASMFVTVCLAGGLESGCGARLLTLLVQLGEHMGYLFQLRDDLLDVLSTQRKEGKPVHMDFREGIFTLPVLYAMEHPAYRARVQALANRAAAGQLTEQDVSVLSVLIRQSGGIERTVRLMHHHQACAENLLQQFPGCAATELIGGMLALLSADHLLAGEGDAGATVG